MPHLDRDEYRYALVMHGKCDQLIRQHPEDGNSSDAFIRRSVTCGIYAHFKSTEEHPKLYAVLGVARKVNRVTDRFDPYEYHVLYFALYPPHLMTLATRELVGPDGFLMPIDRTLESGERYVGARFRPKDLCIPGNLFLSARKYVEC